MWCCYGFLEECSSDAVREFVVQSSSAFQWKEEEDIEKMLVPRLLFGNRKKVKG